MGSPGQLVLLVGTATVLAVTIYAASLTFVPFVAGLDSLRLQHGPTRVELRGLDAISMHRSGYVLAAIPPLALPAGIGWSLALGALVIAIWWGFRVRVTVSASETEVRHSVLWIVPWKRMKLHACPRLQVDGWGDFADPEALHLAFAQGPKLELGWGHARSGDRASTLAEEFNRAVAGLG